MKNIKITLLIIFIIALLLRIGFVIFYDNGKMLQNKHYAADEYSYDQIATNFLNGKGLVTDDGLYARRVPIYPLFLAVIYFIFGHSLVAVRFTQSIISALGCLIIYLIGKELFSKKIGLISAFFSAIYYPFILQPAYLLNEVFSAFLLSISIYFLLRYYNNKNLLYLVFWSSLILGLASLCRENILYFLFFIFIWLFCINRYKIKDSLIPIFIFFLGICLTVGFWVIRNYFLYNAFIPTTLSGGHALYYGNNPKATGGTGGQYSLNKDSFLPQDLEYRVYTLEADRKLYKLALRYIKEHPQRFLFLSIKKIINMWRPFYSDARLLNKIIMSIQYIPIIFFAFNGIFFNLRKNKALWLLGFLIFYYIVIHAITISEIRYRYPVMPYLIIFSAIGINNFLIRTEKPN